MKHLVLILLMCCGVTTFAHKSYISIANIEYNAKTKALEASLKITAHDFERIIAERFNTTLKLEDINDSSAVGIQIQQYIAQYINVWSGGKKAVFNYVGKEVTLRDELFFYFTFKQVLNPSHIYIRNSILFDLFSKQQNIVHYKYSGEIKSITLTPDNEKGEIKF